MFSCNRIRRQPICQHNRNVFATTNFVTTTFVTAKLSLRFPDIHSPNYLSIYLILIYFDCSNMFYFKRYVSNMSIKYIFISNSLWNYNLCQSSYCGCGSCHIFNIVSIAILTILTILLTVSTFVFKSNINIFTSALNKVFYCWKFRQAL